MKNFRQLGSAVALSLFIGAGMVTFSSTLHAAGPSDRSVKVRCELIQRAIDSATALFGADSELAVYLQGLYDSNCAG
jgi:hypothetical protein